MTKREAAIAAMLAKAKIASRSAKALLEIGDVDGAANRAYYAMFDAAKAALLSRSDSGEGDMARTHSGLISAFGNTLVKSDLV